MVGPSNSLSIVFLAAIALLSLDVPADVANGICGRFLPFGASWGNGLQPFGHGLLTNSCDSCAGISEKADPMYDESTYGDSIADIYDELYGPVSASEVDLLAELAGIGPALELGIGTGRVSIPLAGKGLEVWGIDSSQAMLDKVVEGPGGAGVQVVIGNMADVDVDRHFQLVFVVTHTLFCLREQSEQLRCFGTSLAGSPPTDCS